MLILGHLSLEMKVNISTLCMTAIERVFGSWLIAMFIVSDFADLNSLTKRT